MSAPLCWFDLAAGAVLGVSVTSYAFQIARIRAERRRWAAFDRVNPCELSDAQISDWLHGRPFSQPAVERRDEPAASRLVGGARGRP